MFCETGFQPSEFISAIANLATVVILLLIARKGQIITDLAKQVAREVMRELRESQSIRQRIAEQEESSRGKTEPIRKDKHAGPDSSGIGG